MPSLTTRFHQSVDEEQLDNLTLWLDQTELRGFEGVDCRFEYTAEGSIRCRVPASVAAAQLPILCAEIDATLRRIVADLGPVTTSDDG